MKYKKEINIAIVLVEVLILVIFGLLVHPHIKKSNIKPDIPEDKSEINIPGWEVNDLKERFLGQDIYIVGIGTYSGAFVEDGRDAPVENVLAVLVTNRSKYDLQYAEISLETETGMAEFLITTLPSGGTALVLEANAGEFSAKGYSNGVMVSSAFFQDGLQLYPEHFDLDIADGVINIMNIGSDIKGDLYVYYKNIVNGVYMGGITYRTRLSGGLSAKEMYQMTSSHVIQERSKVLFITYAE